MPGICTTPTSYLPSLLTSLPSLCLPSLGGTSINIFMELHLWHLPACKPWHGMCAVVAAALSASCLLSPPSSLLLLQCHASSLLLCARLLGCLLSSLPLSAEKPKAGHGGQRRKEEKLPAVPSAAYSYRIKANCRRRRAGRGISRAIPSLGLAAYLQKDKPQQKDGKLRAALHGRTEGMAPPRQPPPRHLRQAFSHAALSPSPPRTFIYHL